MILFRYFTREVLGTFIVISLVLLLIFISNQFARYLTLTAAGKLLGMQLLHLILLEVPQLLSIIFPLAFYLSIILAYGRLYVDSEMLVLSACGLSPKKLLGMTFLIATFVAIPVMLFTLWINPIVANTRDKLLAEIGATSVLQTLQPGRFQQTNSGTRIFYIEKMSSDKQKLENLFVAEKGKEGSWSVMSASGGHHEVDQKTQDRFVVADDGYRYQGVPGTKNFTIVHFDHYGVRINLPVLDRGDVIDSVPTLQLLFPPPGQRSNYAAELQWRLSMPLCIYLLSFIAFSLSYVKPRQGRFGKLLPAVLIYIIYANFMIVGQDWISDGQLTPKLGLWIMHLGILGVGFLDLRESYTHEVDSTFMIIGRYIGSTLIKATLLVLLVFVGLEIFILLATQVNSLGKGSYNIGQAFLYVLLILPQQTYLLFPMAGLLGMLFGLSTLANSSELVILRASGVSPARIMRYAMQAGLILVIFVTFVGEVIGPPAKHLGEKRKLIATSSGQALKTGEGLWLRQGQDFYHIEQIDSSHRVENVSRYVFDNSQHLLSVSFAKMGKYNHDAWQMENIQQSNFLSSSVTSQIIPTQAWDLAIDPRLLRISLSTPDEMSLTQLSDYINYQKQTNLMPVVYQLSFWQRILQPLASLVMMFLAIPFVFGPLRSVTTSLRLVLGIVVGFIFYLTNQLFPPLSQVLAFPPYLAAVIPVLIFALFGVFLLRRVR